MSQTNSREATPTTDFYMIDDDEMLGLETYKMKRDVFKECIEKCDKAL